jgi:hypothetical protein
MLYTREIKSFFPARTLWKFIYFLIYKPFLVLRCSGFLYRLTDAKGYGRWDYYMEDVDSWEIGFDEISEGVGSETF